MFHFRFLVFLFCASVAGAQVLPNLTPSLGRAQDVSPRAQKQLAQCQEIVKKLEAGAAKLSLAEMKIVRDKLSAAEKKIVEKYEFYEDVWQTIPDGCSWYCGGGPYKMIASSSLKSDGGTQVLEVFKDFKVFEKSDVSSSPNPGRGTDYGAENAHDFSLKTAWVPGKPGNGIHEYLEYYFKNDSPRVNEIIVYNGYQKSEKTWRENARGRKLKLTVNGSPLAILKLADSRADQHFLVDTLGRRPDGKDLILRFEILEIYKGTRYEDVAISEIEFSGIDVH